MKVSTIIKDESAILIFEVDQILGYEAEEFQNTLLNCLEGGIKLVIVDLSKVKFISSWGIGMLIHGLTTTSNRGFEFRIACLTENVLQVFKKVKIDTILDIYDTVDKAMSR